MVKNFGDFLYEDIDGNEFLNEIYENILYNYSLKLFNNPKATRKEVDISSALRFADILSKSVHLTNSDKHKMWSQEIVALLRDLYPEHNEIQLYLESVLLNVGNYRGLSQHQSKFQGTNILDILYNNYIRDSLKVSEQSELTFFKSQKAVYDNLNKKYLSYSGPTSMGKSFIMRMFIKEQIRSGAKNNFAIVVPTKALINEVNTKLIDDLKDMLNQNNYKIVTSSGSLALKNEHNFILIMTPERLLYTLTSFIDLKLNYVFIDEAHKLSSKDKRTPYYYKLIELISNNHINSRIIFSSPNIPNPEIYLTSIPTTDTKETCCLSSTYAPVNQTKYLVDLTNNNILSFNEHVNKFNEVCKFNRSVTIVELVSLMDKNSQNIVYCSSTNKAVELALEYSKVRKQNFEISNDLKILIKHIKKDIHNDYYLAECLEQGVAYHIGYLPANIRLKIEDLYKIGDIKTVFCTSTLIEGVNLPADNLFITSYKNGRANMNPVEFKNLVGRVGRIEYNLYGNVILVRENSNVDITKLEELLQVQVPEQKLSISTELTKGQKNEIIESLISGNIELIRYPKNQSQDNYSLMRKFAIMLLNDILSERKNSVIIQNFSDVLTDDIIAKVRSAFSDKPKIDDDINISVDQVENLNIAILNGLKYPSYNGSFNYNEIYAFLEKLCDVFKWEVYEKDTLGHRSKENGNLGKLRWYTVILIQWMTGNGLSLIMSAAIEDKNKTHGSKVKINGQLTNYDDSKKHRNIVMSSALDAIEQIILFRISNYFLRFSLEYKKIHNITEIRNDYYEFVEYGTTNPLTIFLQRNGFTRETATFIKTHKKEYIVVNENEYKIRLSIVETDNELVVKEVNEIRYNVPELFISEPI